MSADQRFEYRVERDIWSAERADVALVRRRRTHGLSSYLHHDDESPKVIYFRRFRPATESEALERYAEALERVARHMRDGTMGCFIDTQSSEEQVHVRLYERWFDGNTLHCEELAYRAFDADREDALVASAEFIAELTEWRHRRDEQRDLENEQRNIAELEAAITDEQRATWTRERKQRADELAGLSAGRRWVHAK